MDVVKTEKAPGAIGPYSQGIRAGNLLFVSGQLPIDMKSGELAAGIQAQTRASLTNLKNIVESAGSDLNKVVKTTVFLSDMQNFVPMNEVYAEFFPENCPARSAVEVARLPKDALIEIECIALV